MWAADQKLKYDFKLTTAILASYILYQYLGGSLMCVTKFKINLIVLSKMCDMPTWGCKKGHCQVTYDC